MSFCLKILSIHSELMKLTELSFEEGGCSSDGPYNTWFSDSTDVLMSSMCNVGSITGTFKPQQPLSAFNGLSASGTWTLTVTDIVNSDSGNIKGFKVKVEVASAKLALTVPFTNLNGDKVN